MCLVFAGHPLDLIKVRLQTMEVVPGQPAPYKGTLDCAMKTFKKDGARGLYRGMGAPLIGVTPIFAICFWGYDVGKDFCRYVAGMQPADQLSLNQIMFAGGFSAIPTTIVMTPGDRIKCILQVQGQAVESGAAMKRYSGPVDVVKGLYREGGIASLYKGTVATLWRDVPGSVAYFGAYELFKRALTPEGSTPAQLNPGAVLVGGGMAGIANWMVSLPFDTIKSRLQTAPEGTYTGMLDVARKTIAQSGVSGLFRGLGPAMLRAFPANAACFMGMEVSMKVLNLLW